MRKKLKSMRFINLRKIRVFPRLTRIFPRITLFYPRLTRQIKVNYYVRTYRTRASSFKSSPPSRSLTTPTFRALTSCALPPRSVLLKVFANPHLFFVGARALFRYCCGKYSDFAEPAKPDTPANVSRCFCRERSFRPRKMVCGQKNRAESRARAARDTAERVPGFYKPNKPCALSISNKQKRN